jgi:hypothetical protein
MKLLLALALLSAPAFAGPTCNPPIYQTGDKVIVGAPTLHLENYDRAYFPGDDGDLNYRGKMICQLCGWGNNVADVKAGVHDHPAFLVHIDERNQIDNIIWNKDNQTIVSALSCTK